MREWNVKIYILDEAGNQRPATCFNKVTYNLHPSFENPNQSTQRDPNMPDVRTDRAHRSPSQTSSHANTLRFSSFP